MTTIVRRFAAHEWPLYRDLRLRALADSPQVAPEHRSKGIGAFLLDAVLAWVRSTSAKELRLRVTSGDTPAVRLYRRAGFVDRGEPEPLRAGATLLSQPMYLAL